MEAKVLLIMNPKGGMGKTTLARMLASYYRDKGTKYQIVDMGSQLSIYKSTRHLKDKDIDRLIIPLITDSEDTFVSSLTRPSEENELLIIDSNANLKKSEICMLLGAADFVLVPITGVDIDLIATIDFCSYLDTVREGGLPVRSVVNKKDSTTEYRTLKEFSRMTLKLKPLDTEVRNHAFYKRLQITDKPNDVIMNIGREIDKILCL